MKYLLITFSLMGLAPVTFGALHPYDERVREINLVLDSEAVRNIVSSEKYDGKASGIIDSVTRGPEKYLYPIYHVRSGQCYLTVTFSDNTPEGLIGPPQYDVHPAKEMKCKE